jgi:hypothetical protein
LHGYYTQRQIVSFNLLEASASGQGDEGELSHIAKSVVSELAEIQGIFQMRAA